MILITGSDGIIGRQLCKELLAQEILFLPVTHRRKSHTLRNALYVNLADDIELLFGYLSSLSAIVHLAAAVPHSTYYPDNDESAECTRRMDRHIRHIQELTRVPLIYASTCGLYDRSSPSVKFENDSSQLKIASPYFAAKYEGEKLFLNDYNSTVLRLSAPVGYGLKPQLVLSRFISTARMGGKIKVWGSGNREQDFIDTVDIAKLIISILKKPQSMILNVASGTPITMKSLAQTVVSSLGSGSIVFTSQPDSRDEETARYSISLAKDHFNWAPQCTLDKSIKNLIDENFERNV